MSNTNWASNYTFQAQGIDYPQTVAALQAIVKAHNSVKVVGSRHSFNAIADTTAQHISLAQMPRIFALDAAKQQVTVGAGMAYGAFCEALHQAGFALHNLASLPHISVAGAVATATHGSGNSNGNLATAVAAIEMVAADGSLVTLSRDADGDLFAGAVVGLGALGIVTQLTLDVQPTFEVQQWVYENLSMTTAAADFDAIMGAGYSVSLFTEWQTAHYTQVWIKRKASSEAEAVIADDFYGATLADDHRHPIAGIAAEPCTPQCGIAGAWHDRLPHFRMAYTPSSGNELQTEYFVRRADAAAAIQAVSTLAAEIAPLIMVTEIRTVAADNFWLSPCYAQASVAIHFTWHPAWEAVRQLLPRIEAQLAPYAARPHWGKLFTLSAEQLQTRYSRLPDFQRLMQQYDPQGKFSNQFLKRYLG